MHVFNKCQTLNLINFFFFYHIWCTQTKARRQLSSCLSVMFIWRVTWRQTEAGSFLTLINLTYIALFGLIRSSLCLSGGLKPKIIFVPSSLSKHDENLFQSSHRHVGSHGTIRKGFRLGLYDETWQLAMWSTNSCVISWRGGGWPTLSWTTAIRAGDYSLVTYGSRRIDIWGLIMDKSMEPIDLWGKEGVEMYSRVNK